jgi:hypothetical protein
MKEKIRFEKFPKMTVTDHNLAVQLRSSQFYQLYPSDQAKSTKQMSEG